MQNRSEWLSWRHQGIGSSDAGILWGVSQYQTPLELWESKINPVYEEKPMNMVQAKGTRLEPIARARFAALHNMENGTSETFDPKCVEMSGYNFMRASLDGSSLDGSTIIEIKFQSEPYVEGTPLAAGQQRHRNVLRQDLPITSMNDEIECRVKYLFYCQVQHQLCVTGAERCIFISFDGESLNTCEILPDITFMKSHMDKCQKFWNLVLTKVPPPLSSRDYKEIRVKGSAAIARKYKQLDLKIKELDAEKDKLREELIKLAEFEKHPRTTCAGVKILLQQGRGGIDYEKIIQDYKVETDKYRKPNGKPFYKIL